MLEVGLDAGGVERLVVTKEGEVARVVFEMSLRRREDQYQGRAEEENRGSCSGGGRRIVVVRR